MNVIITGSTGMIGKGVLLECLDDRQVQRVLLVNRNPIGMDHPKMKEVLLKDFSDPSPIEAEMSGYDAAFFCLGISAGGMKEEDYRRITYDYTIRFAETFLKANPQATFIYVSGQGTDSTESGRMMWARVKGKTENDLQKMGFKKAYMFRPGIIRPLRGIESRTPSYRIMYKVIKPLWPILQKLMGNRLTDTTRIGKAMIRVSVEGSDQVHFENPAINRLAG